MTPVIRVLSPPGHPYEATRLEQLATLREDVRLGGAVAAGLHVVGDGYVDRIDLAALRAADPEADLAATWAAADARPDALGAILLLVVRDGEDGRTAILLDRPGRGVDVRVTELAWRRDATQGAVVLTRNWTEATFTPADHGRLSPAIAALLSPRPGARPAALAEPRPGELVVDRWYDPDPSARVASPDAAHLAVRAASRLAPDLARGARKGRLVLTTAGERYEVWALRGPLPCPEDDVLRQIARHTDGTDGIARAHIGTVPGSEPARPCVLVEAELHREEAGLTRAALVVPILQGADGEPEVRAASAVRDPGPPRWLGVPPRFRVGFGEMEGG